MNLCTDKYLLALTLCPPSLLLPRSNAYTQAVVSLDKSVHLYVYSGGKGHGFIGCTFVPVSSSVLLCVHCPERDKYSSLTANRM